MNKLIKKIIHFKAREEKNLEGVELWKVQWYARNGSFNHDWNIVAEVFTNKKDAEFFYNQLREARKLLKYTENINLELIKM